MNQNEKKSNSFINILIIFFVVLFLLSMALLVTRLNISLPFTDDTFVVNPEFDSVEYGDDETLWDLDTSITIFKYHEVDENGNIVVESIDGENVIAPGMEGDYVFEVRNLGKFAVDINVTVYAELTVNGEKFDNTPIEIQFTDYLGESNNNGWHKVSDLSDHHDSLTIGKKSYVYYTLDWRWLFDGDNELDTILGDLSVNNDVEFTINIVASATRSADKNSEGGLPLNQNIVEPGLLDIRPFIAFNVIIFLIIVILLICADYKRRKKEEKYKKVSSKNKK